MLAHDPTETTFSEIQADGKDEPTETAKKRQEVVWDIAALVVAEHRRRQARAAETEPTP